MLSGVSRRTRLPQWRQNKRGRAREQQLQVIVELRHRADGGARGAHGIGLIDRDGRQDSFDAIHLRLVHAIEELARIGRERLHVAPLALGVQGVEDQRGFPRARDARYDDELVQRDAERQVLEIVLPRAMDLDRLGSRICARHPRGRTTAGGLTIGNGARRLSVAHGQRHHSCKWNRGGLELYQRPPLSRHPAVRGLGGAAGCTRRRRGPQYGCRKTSPRHTGTAGPGRLSESTTSGDAQKIIGQIRCIIGQHMSPIITS